MLVAMRGSLIAVIAVGVAVANVAYASGGSRTVVHFYRAYAQGRLRPQLVVTVRVRGRCDTGTEIEKRRYVWRCVWGNFLADPCFSAAATGSSAFCPLAPWSMRGAIVRARLRGWKPVQPAIIRTWPWGIELTNGQRCRAIRTGTSFIRRMRMNHGCDGGGFLVGPVDRRSRVWTILYGNRFDGDRTKLTRVRIRTAWW